MSKEHGVLLCLFSSILHSLSVSVNLIVLIGIKNGGVIKKMNKDNASNRDSVDISNQPVENENEQPDAWHIFAEDIEQPLLLVNSDGIIIYINHDPDSKNRAEIVGTNIYDHFPECHEEKLRFTLKNAFADAQPQHYEVRLTDGNQEAIWKRTDIRPVIRQGHVDLAIVLTTDISEQKRIERDLQMIEDKLTEALHMVDKPEEIITVCAWTKQIKINGEWQSLEDFLQSRFGFKISHGIADDALQEQLNGIVEDHKRPKK